MRKQNVIKLFHVAAIAMLLGACSPQISSAKPETDASVQEPLHVLAVESFLGDIVQNVAGDRVKVESLMPLGIDPHAFEPTPSDVAKISNSDVIVVIGAGLEEWLDETLQNAGGKHTLIEASQGITGRTPAEGESPEGEGEHADETDADAHDAAGEEGNHHHHEGDPHFWLDPIKVITFVENIRDGLSAADPQGAAIYAENARKYTQQLEELDRWIKKEVDKIPAGERLLVTNHESLGYFADRYGFKVIGTVIPSVSTSASPSAQQLAALVDSIKTSGAKAVFLETGANPVLAEQAANEAGVKLVTQLYTHSLTDTDGDAPTYIDMMKYNTSRIIEGLGK